MPTPHPALAFLTVLIAGLALGRWVPVEHPGLAPAWVRIGGGLLLVKVAVGLVVAGIVVLHRAATAIEPGRTPTSLVTAGPYRFSRNPMYLGQILFLLGLGFAYSPWLVGLALVQGLLLDRLVIPPEEARIEARFGEAFQAYRAKVRRWI